MKILICDAFDPTLPDLLKKHGEVTSDINELPNATVALVRSKTKGDRDFIDKGKSLKMIIRGGVGLDNIDVKYAREKNIEVRNTAEASSIAVAELAFAMMIAVPNRLVEANTSMQAGKWMKKELKRTELYGKILGIIGCGRIGTELARRAKAFGMMVVGYDPSVDVSDDILIKPTLEDMLPICDYISIHTPLTDRTRGFINKETIARMKNGVVIINTGRGKCVIEADVVDALKSGKIGFYANDVWYSDPPETTPLVGAPNTLLAPHIGASTNENLLRIGKAVDRIITKAADAGFFGK
ncbi:MAG: hydroxyacid dehydrogenase [candidate division Zixibacteria bacterium]|nr:hydroxyacid dehydrogenase [candidate division Zixibacteria bacterium]